ncbi:MAG TPA: GNAT family N-acetyltransferase [Marmoricola sp.]|nr:GNAT family N-acetyltransferase [Marmoricola sp.]
MYRVEFLTDAAQFLERASAVLQRDPVVSTVIATMAEREARAEGSSAPDDRPYWWAVVRDEAAEVVSCAMRTAPFDPHPLLLMPMPEPAARALARALAERGECVQAANGFRPATDIFADEIATLTGRTSEVTVHMRLFELGTLVPPAPVPGRLRVATPEDLDLCVAWFDAFADAADEQAGRPAGTLREGRHERDGMLRRIDERRVCFWVDEQDRPVHLTGFNLPAFGVARIGPVYTPPEHRGGGLASNAVAEVSRSLQADGAVPCLYTDQANPVSNRIYQALGYVAVADQVNIALR